MSGLQFNEEAARQLERLYLTSDVVAQRSETIRLLAPGKGERVLDVGCGPGFLCEGIAEVVGRDGAVTGIDISGDLIALCKRRNPPTWLSYLVGDAINIDQPDASFDVVACTQVAEYVPDVDRVVYEAFRILRPGGRAVFVATDWDAVVWHSDRPDRMAVVMRSWEAHCAHPHLPRSLAGRLASAGFRFDGASVFPILNLQWHDDAYSKGLAGLIRDFVGRRNDVPSDDLRDWYEEFAPLSEAGRYFFRATATSFARQSRTGEPHRLRLLLRAENLGSATTSAANVGLRGLPGPSPPCPHMTLLGTTCCTAGWWGRLRRDHNR